MNGNIIIYNYKLIFCYYHDFYGKTKMMEDLEKKNINLKGLHLSIQNIISDEECVIYDNQYSEEEETFFLIGNVTNNFIYLCRSVFNLNYDFCFERCLFDNELSAKYLFIYYSQFGTRTNIISTISSYAKSDCYIVNSNNENIGKNGFIPFDAFEELISRFPTITEIQKYKKYRIEEIIGNFFDDQHMYSDYISYMNKRIKGYNSFKIDLNVEFDLFKYEYIRDKLKNALGNTNISEKKWQEELIPIIRLLYPRYIKCLSGVKIKKTAKEDKEIDYLLVDAKGNTMIIELKKPFSDKKLLANSYRKNFYQPKFELVGGIQQIESYIYDLNFDKKENIEKINDDFKDELDGIKINLIDTQGTLICGRSNYFNEEEKRDFEIIRKQYKNIVDIITYDDLLERLEITINLLRKKHNELSKR